METEIGIPESRKRRICPKLEILGKTVRRKGLQGGLLRRRAEPELFLESVGGGVA